MIVLNEIVRFQGIFTVTIYSITMWYGVIHQRVRSIVYAGWCCLGIAWALQIDGQALHHPLARIPVEACDAVYDHHELVGAEISPKRTPFEETQISPTYTFIGASFEPPVQWFAMLLLPHGERSDQIDPRLTLSQAEGNCSGICQLLGQSIHVVSCRLKHVGVSFFTQRWRHRTPLQK